jgi:hypothetical protein
MTFEPVISAYIHRPDEARCRAIAFVQVALLGSIVGRDPGSDELTLVMAEGGLFTLRRCAGSTGCA